MTFYLWDLAGTIFQHEWDSKAGGFVSFEDYLRSIGKDPQNLSAWEFENSNVEPLRHGWFGGLPVEGFETVLSQTKNNYIFTTGNKAQLDARAEFLGPKLGFDLRTLFRGVYTTFDFGDTNLKTPAMFQAIAKDAIAKGYKRIVYTDDNPELIAMFRKALKSVKGIEAISYSSVMELSHQEKF